MSSIIKVDTVQDIDGNNIINENANTITIGASGDTITIPSGATFDASASTTTLPDDSVTLAKMASGTDGNIISYDASGNPVAVATGTDGQVLTSTGAGSPPAFETLPVGGITQADQWRLSSPMQLTTNDITANLERVDDSGFGYVGDGMTESSGVFSFPETGIYRVDLNATFYFTSGSGESRYIMVRTQTTTDNSSYSNVARAITSIDDFIANTISSSCSSTIYLDVTDTSNVKVKFTTSSATPSGYYLDGTTGDNYTTFTFTRLGDT